MTPCLIMQIANLYPEAGESVVSRYQHKLVESTDANNNTPLSEAGAGGDPDTIKWESYRKNRSSCRESLCRLLIQLGANPNTKGQYGRTPLYRAAFAGHLDAVKVRVTCSIMNHRGKSCVGFAGSPRAGSWSKINCRWRCQSWTGIWLESMCAYL